MAWKLQGSNPGRPTLAVVSLNLIDATLAAMETPQSPPSPPQSAGRRHMALLHPEPVFLSANSVEMPFLMERYERFRELGEPELINRRRAQQHLLRDSELAYVKKTSRPLLSDWQRGQIVKFARNLALSCGGLVPGQFDLIAAARAVVDDDYACEVRDLAARYEPQTKPAGSTLKSLSTGSIWDRQSVVRLRPRLHQLTRSGDVTTLEATPLDRWLALDPVLGAHKWDAVVVIFDEDRADSDLTQVSSTPWGASYQVRGTDRLGGLLRVSGEESDEDLWTRPEFDHAETKAERLLLAALCRSSKQRVVYIGPHPPRPIMRSVASHLERVIAYVPLGQVPTGLLVALRA